MHICIQLQNIMGILLGFIHTSVCFEFMPKIILHVIRTLPYMLGKSRKWVLHISTLQKQSASLVSFFLLLIHIKWTAVVVAELGRQHFCFSWKTANLFLCGWCTSVVIKINGKILIFFNDVRSSESIYRLRYSHPQN